MKKLFFIVFVAFLLSSCGQNNSPVNDMSKDTSSIEIVNKIWSMESERVLEFDKELSQLPEDKREAKLLEILALEPTPIVTQYIGNMNSAEAAICSTNAWDCWKTKSTSDNAKARAIAIFGDSEKWRGRGDAFRHAYWNALMVAEISFDWAKRFADAHEAFEPNNSETRMDYHNNYIGRRIGIRGGSRGSLENHVLRSVYNGRLVCLSAHHPNAPIKRTGRSPCF